MILVLCSSFSFHFYFRAIHVSSFINFDRGRSVPFFIEIIKDSVFIRGIARLIL